MTQREFRLFTCTSAIALIVYSLTFARDISFVDSGELAVAIASQGIAHPPGFPTYTLIGQIFLLLPWSVSTNLAFMSTLFGALTAGFVSLLFQQVFGREKSLFFFAIITGLSFALASTPWLYSNVIEVYTLNTFFLSGSLYFLGKALKVTSPFKWFFSAGLFYGLAFGIHHVTVALMFPSFVWLTLGTLGRRKFWSVAAVPSATGILLGLASYIYLPLAASQGPSFNWGNPSTFTQFWHHISGKQYQVAVFGVNSSQFLEQLKYFIETLTKQFSIFSLPLIGIGIFQLKKSHTLFFKIALLAIVLNFLYSANFNNAEDKDAYYMPTVLFLSVTFGAGLRSIHLKAIYKSKLLFALPALVLPLLFLHNYSKVNRKDYRLPREYVENVLAAVPQNGLVFTLDWQFYSPFLYLNLVEQFRKDAIVIDIHLMRRTWYLVQFLPEHYPNLMSQVKLETRLYLEDLQKFEHNLPYDSQQIQARFESLLFAMVQAQHKLGRTAFTTLPAEDVLSKTFSWRPTGLVMKLDQSNVSEFLPQTPLNIQSLRNTPVGIDEVVDKKIRSSYSAMFTNRGRYLTTLNRFDEAEREYQIAILVDSSFVKGHEFLGELYFQNGKRKAAENAFQEVLRLDPKNKLALERMESLK